MMELPPAGDLPLWVSLAEKGFYGFKPSVCAFCCLKTHDILQRSEREYFPEFVQKHINMRNNSKRHWNNPYSELYTSGLKKHLYLCEHVINSILSTLMCHKSLRWKTKSLYCWNHLNCTLKKLVKDFRFKH